MGVRAASQLTRSDFPSQPRASRSPAVLPGAGRQTEGRPPGGLFLLQSTVSYRIRTIPCQMTEDLFLCPDRAVQPFPENACYFWRKLTHSVWPTAFAPSPIIVIRSALHRCSSLYRQFTALHSTSILDSGVLNRFLNNPPRFSSKLPQQVSQESCAPAPSTRIP